MMRPASVTPWYFQRCMSRRHGAAAYGTAETSQASSLPGQPYLPHGRPPGLAPPQPGQTKTPRKEAYSFGWQSSQRTLPSAAQTTQ